MMNRKTVPAICLAALITLSSWSHDLNWNPTQWKWLDNSTAYFSDGKTARLYNAPRWTIDSTVVLTEEKNAESIAPEGAVNPVWSPDSTKIAYTKDNDLYVIDALTRKETRITRDGSDLILNGYASWVYYEEIFGRPSKYRAFWWSPDSRKLAFYRFDQSKVPMFPIFSPFGQDGTLNKTRYPKAGETNPTVEIWFADLSQGRKVKTIRAEFDSSSDVYYGTPFWGSDSKELFVQREPRLQNHLELFAVSATDGSKRLCYEESSETWLDWIEGMLFAENGLYMVRSFETPWQQIYYLSYDGKELRRLSEGDNWRVKLIRADKDGSVWFTAERDCRYRQALYKLERNGKVKAMSNPALHVSKVLFSPDGSYLIYAVSALDTPTVTWICESRYADIFWKSRQKVEQGGPVRYNTRYASAGAKVSQLAKEDGPVPSIITIEYDGQILPATVCYPKDFDTTRRYPVHVDLYGGPDTPQVCDRWKPRYGADRWYYDNGIIQVVADCRASGHGGRAGLDQVYRHLNDLEVKDFIAWGRYLQSLPYVDPVRIGVEGFSFGGTMTVMLLCEAPDVFHYGIAGGGVYDWALYDTHYTERFMSTPSDNPEGYALSRVLDHVPDYPVSQGSADGSVMLKITHGTGDDNVHFQNTLQLIDRLQKEGKGFELMIYPDGMHGYRGYQGNHSRAEDRRFWSKYLLGN